MEQNVAEFQLDLMQRFMRIQMEAAFGDAWKEQVKQVVEHKFQTNNSFKQNYQGIYNLLRNEGIELLNERRFDVTSITAICLYDFYQECKVGTSFRQHIRNIQKDKNSLVSHISDTTDELQVKILELTALKNLRTFLFYLDNSEWSFLDRECFINEHLNQIDQMKMRVLNQVTDEQENTLEFESTKSNYLNRIISERNANQVEYMPLSYKADDGTSKRCTLEEVFSLPENKNGFVLFADAGYGKTWSLQELAGRCAEQALESSSEINATPILIKMGQLAVHREPILKTVQELLFPGEDKIETTREFLKTNPVILFVDGMDEAIEENKDSVRKEMINLMEGSNQLKIIGGTRDSDTNCFPDDLPKYTICNLSDKQIYDFIMKFVKEEKRQSKAVYDYFENDKTSFLKNLRSPFYIKCFVDFINEGELEPDSDTDMMSRCIDRMIEREIKLKGFKASVQIVNDFLANLSKDLGERRYISMSEALKSAQQNVLYDTKTFASIVQIKDTLVELQIIREIMLGRHSMLLGFAHEKYKSLYSPIALDTSIWDYD